MSAADNPIHYDPATIATTRGDLAPGSAAAFDAGCTCPAMDNAYGRGYWRTGADKALFVVTADCPLHSQHSAPGHARTFGYHASAEPEPDPMEGKIHLAPHLGKLAAAIDGWEREPKPITAGLGAIAAGMGKITAGPLTAGEIAAAIDVFYPDDEEPPPAFSGSITFDLTPDEAAAWNDLTEPPTVSIPPGWTRERIETEPGIFFWRLTPPATTDEEPRP